MERFFAYNQFISKFMVYPKLTEETLKQPFNAGEHHFMNHWKLGQETLRLLFPTDIQIP